MNKIDIYLHYIDFYIILYTPSDLQGQTYFIYGKSAAFRQSNPISAAAGDLMSYLFFYISSGEGDFEL